MIGIFDSGYGGLTVMKEIAAALPQYDYLYLGDNARTPYGNRSKEIVTQFTEEAVEYLFNRGAELIIIACFTASALALRALQEKYLRNSHSKFRDRKILGVIKPVVEMAVGGADATAPCRASGEAGSCIGVTGTRGTINSNAFGIELMQLQPKLTVVQQACPLLVPLIEEGWHQKPEARMVLRKYLRSLKAHHVDTLILGCTHYPLMMADFKRIMGKNVRILDTGKIVAKSLVEYLKRHPEIEKKLTRGGKKEFCTTEDEARFSHFAREFGKMEVAGARQIKL